MSVAVASLGSTGGRGSGARAVTAQGSPRQQRVSAAAAAAEMDSSSLVSFVAL